MTTAAADQDTITFVEATRLALDEAMAADERVVLLGEDVADDEGGGVCKATLGLSGRYGTSRVRSTPISEQVIVGAAIGASLAGLIPVAEIMLMNLIPIALDQLHNHAAKLRYMTGGRSEVPITIRTLCGGGIQFGAQHSDMLETWLAHSPGVKIAIPSTPADAKGLLLSCIFDPDPCVFLEPSMLYFGGASGARPEDGSRVPLGRANVVRAGTDATVVAYGKPVLDALAAATALADQGLDVEVIDLRTIVPLDERTILESVARTKRAVVVHESVKRFGVGAEISSRIHEELHSELAAPVRRVAAPYCSVPYSALLENRYLPGQGDIEAAIRSVTGA